MTHSHNFGEVKRDMERTMKEDKTDMEIILIVFLEKIIFRGIW